MSDYVLVPVREDFIPRVYELLADLERERGTEVSAPADADAEPALDEGMARRMFRESEDRHRRLLRYLADNAGRWVPMDELGKALGASREQMAGVFGAFGRRANYRYSGRTPWDKDWRSEKGEYAYRMPPEVARWIAAEVADLEPETDE